MMTTRPVNGAEATDAELVSETLTGSREAFGRIVTRYQSLICSLAYSSTCCLGQSEDLAQETFITAWRHLRHLRERDKLRAWLCGIARNRIGKALRRDGLEPVHAAEPLDTVHESSASEPLPPDHAIGKEEEAFLWRSLERIGATAAKGSAVAKAAGVSGLAGAILGPIIGILGSYSASSPVGRRIHAPAAPAGCPRRPAWSPPRQNTFHAEQYWHRACAAG